MSGQKSLTIAYIRVYNRYVIKTEGKRFLSTWLKYIL